MARSANRGLLPGQRTSRFGSGTAARDSGFGGEARRAVAFTSTTGVSTLLAMSDTKTRVVNVDEVEETTRTSGDHWGASFKPLTPAMRPGGGRLGVNQMRLEPGRAAVPFHLHHREDEVFFVLSGRGVLRYGAELRELRAGDCVSCPAGSGVAHQLANPFDEDFVYLAIGPFDPHEVCEYPDSGKVLVRALRTVGTLEQREYMSGEPKVPKILDLWEAQGQARAK